jgi:WD40 repeat protein
MPHRVGVWLLIATVPIAGLIAISMVILAVVPWRVKWQRTAEPAKDRITRARVVVLAVCLGVAGVAAALVGAASPTGKAAPQLGSTTHNFNADNPAVSTSEPQRLTDPASGGIHGVAFSPDGQTIATADGNSFIYIWQAHTHSRIADRSDPHSLGVRAVAFDPVNGQLASADANGNVFLWNLASTSRDPAATLPAPASGALSSVAISYDGKFVAAGSQNGHVYVWDLSTHALTASEDDPNSYGVNSVAFNHADSLLAAGDANGSVYLWARKLSHTLTNPQCASVEAVAFDPGGQLAAGCLNGHVDLWNVATLKYRDLNNAKSYGVNSVAFDSVNGSLAVADSDSDVYLWDPATQPHHPIDTLPDSAKSPVTSVAVSPDGKTVAAGDVAGHLSIWTTGS